MADTAQKIIEHNAKEAVRIAYEATEDYGGEFDRFISAIFVALMQASTSKAPRNG